MKTWIVSLIDLNRYASQVKRELLRALEEKGVLTEPAEDLSRKFVVLFKG